MAASTGSWVGLFVSMRAVPEMATTRTAPRRRRPSIGAACTPTSAHSASSWRGEPGLIEIGLRVPARRKSVEQPGGALEGTPCTFGDGGPLRAIENVAGEGLAGGPRRLANHCACATTSWASSHARKWPSRQIGTARVYPSAPSVTAGSTIALDRSSASHNFVRPPAATADQHFLFTHRHQRNRAGREQGAHQVQQRLHRGELPPAPPIVPGDAGRRGRGPGSSVGGTSERAAAAEVGAFMSAKWERDVVNMGGPKDNGEKALVKTYALPQSDTTICLPTNDSECNHFAAFSLLHPDGLNSNNLMETLPSILIAEDDERTRVLLQTMLEALGYPIAGTSCRWAGSSRTDHRSQSGSDPPRYRDARPRWTRSGAPDSGAPIATHRRADRSHRRGDPRRSAPDRRAGISPQAAGQQGAIALRHRHCDDALSNASAPIRRASPTWRKLCKRPRATTAPKAAEHLWPHRPRDGGACTCSPRGGPMPGIGKELELSPRTVEKHVETHPCQKLGVKSRKAAARRLVTEAPRPPGQEGAAHLFRITPASVPP